MAKAKSSQNILTQSSYGKFLDNIVGKITTFRPNRTVYIISAIVVILALAFYKKDLFIAATVNGSPVSNLELLMRLNQQFRTQTLNQMINEKIIFTEAAKNNAIPIDAEVNNRLSEIETSVGGVEALNNLLKAEGQTRESVKQQIKLQLTIEKLYVNEATVSAEELTQFLETNRAQLRATESAAQEKEAADLLKQQKLSTIFNEKFQTLRQQANIRIF